MATWKAVTLFTGANTAKARSAQDDYQHAWVDGSDGNNGDDKDKDETKNIVNLLLCGALNGW